MTFETLEGPGVESRRFVVLANSLVVDKYNLFEPRFVIIIDKNLCK